MTWSFPWPEPDGAYADDGPNEATDFDVGRTRFRVSPTELIGSGTGRTRFRVECLTCGEVVHPSTTSASIRCEQHAKDCP